MTTETQNGQTDPRQGVMFNAGPIVDEAQRKKAEADKIADEKATALALKLADQKARDSWGTPRELFDPLHNEFQFTVDGCAEQWNKKLDVFIGPGSPYGQDAFTTNFAGHRAWFNVEYSDIDRWLKLIWSWFSPEKRGAPGGPDGRMALAVLLIPASRTEQEFWQTQVEPFRDRPQLSSQFGVTLESRFITMPTKKSKYGRVQFDPPPGIKKSSNTTGSVLLIWRAI